MDNASQFITKVSTEWADNTQLIANKVKCSARIFRVVFIERRRGTNVCQKNKKNLMEKNALQLSNGSVEWLGSCQLPAPLRIPKQNQIQEVEKVWCRKKKKHTQEKHKNLLQRQNRKEISNESTNQPTSGTVICMLFFIVLWSLVSTIFEEMAWAHFALAPCTSVHICNTSICRMSCTFSITLN